MKQPLWAATQTGHSHQECDPELGLSEPGAPDPWLAAHKAGGFGSFFGGTGSIGDLVYRSPRRKGPKSPLQAPASGSEAETKRPGVAGGRGEEGYSSHATLG